MPPRFRLTDTIRKAQSEFGEKLKLDPDMFHVAKVIGGYQCPMVGGVKKDYREVKIYANLEIHKRGICVKSITSHLNTYRREVCVRHLWVEPSF